MNLISILTHFDPEYNYYSLGNQSWSQIELVFGVEKEFIDIFLSKSIDFDIPYKYTIINKNEFQPLLTLADSYFVLFMNKNEIWGPNYLKQIKEFFLERQDLGKSLMTSNQILVDPLAVNRNIFFFLGKLKVENQTNPVMYYFNELHYPFSLSKIIDKPTFFQPGIKFLLPNKFIAEQNISYPLETDNTNLNIAIFYLKVLTYLFKSNNYFEPNYFSCYVDFTMEADMVSLNRYFNIYKEEVYIKREIFLKSNNKDLIKAIKSLKFTNNDLDL